MTTPAARANYQRLRLRMGVLGIGSILVALWICLGLGVPRRLDGLFGGWGGWAGVGAGGLLAAGAVLLQLVPDVVARHADLREGVAVDGQQGRYLKRYWAGVLGFALQVVVAAGLIGWALAPRGLLAEPGMGHAVVAVGLFGLAFTRLLRDPTLGIESEPYEVSPGWIQALDRRLGAAGLERPRLRWFDHGERSLAGGWEGLGSRRRLTLSRSVGELEPGVAAGLVARELGHAEKLHRWVSCVVSGLWLAAGVWLAWAAERWGTGTLGVAGRVFLFAAVMSTWSWVGLFVLPALGRRQVLAADRFMAQRLGDAGEVSAVFEALAGGNLPDEDLSAVKKYVFHPIPPLAVRRAAALNALP